MPDLQLWPKIYGNADHMEQIFERNGTPKTTDNVLQYCAEFVFRPRSKNFPLHASFFLRHVSEREGFEKVSALTGDQIKELRQREKEAERSKV
jgi:hypothetical protein